MAEVTQQIVDDIRSSLADVGFGEVAIGHSAGPLRLPRAEFSPAGLERTPASDCAGENWYALHITLTVMVSNAAVGSAICQAIKLARAAGAKLCGQPFRSGLCRHLPSGPATSVGPARLCPDVNSPYVAVRMDITCRFAV